MKRTSKTLAAVGAMLLLSGVGLASTTMAQDGGPDGTAPPSAESDSRAATRVPVPMETSFVPVKPCRLFDTRNAGGALANGQTRNFNVKGALGSQGGAANCGVPEGATAASVSLTAISQGGTSGFVRGWAAGGSESTATLVNYSPALNASNSVEMPLCAGPCAKDITLKMFGSAHVVGEVLGYFVPPIHASVHTDGEIHNKSSRVISVVRSSRGVYYATIDRSVNGCAVAVTPSFYNGLATSQAIAASNVVEVITYSRSGGSADLAFDLTVSC